MKPVQMKHDKSKMTITVQAEQVENANYYGWYAVDPDDPGIRREVLKIQSIKKGGKDGKGKRK